MSKGSACFSLPLLPWKGEVTNLFQHLDLLPYLLTSIKLWSVVF